jgi:SAM-dependent methyltransferase
MDDLAQYNKQRWEEIAGTRMIYSRPFLGLDRCLAREVVDPEDILGDVTGWEVLCLASGGGQQSSAFGLLGATVTVLDLSETQLERDREAAAHYNLSITTAQGDMRDLSRFPEDGFDLVYQPYSLNFVPDVRPVFQAVARILRQGGLYRLAWANPFTQAVDDELWDGNGYRLIQPYVDGAELTVLFPHWDVEGEDGTRSRIDSPREFRHALSTLINSLVAQGFMILGFWEEISEEPDPEPGSWEHFKSVAVPYLTLWAAYRPDVCAGIPRLAG